MNHDIKDDEYSNSELRLLTMLQQNQKASEQRRHVINLENEELRFDSICDSNALILENLTHCHIYIEGRITHLTMIACKNCHIEVTHPPISGCDVTRSRDTTVIVHEGNLDINTIEPRYIECIYSSNISFIIKVPFRLRATGCIDLLLKTGISQDFYSVPVNPWSPTCEMIFEAATEAIVPTTT